MDDYLQALEPYILNDQNMSTYLKYTFTNSQPKQPLPRCDASNTKSEDGFFVPKQMDSLFWCYYIVAYGESEYHLLNNKNALVAKQIKIQCVQRVRDNKAQLKIHKFDSLVNLESNLVNDHTLNIKTFMALCLIQGFHVVFIRKRSYFELHGSNQGTIYLIKEMPHTYHASNRQYGIMSDNSSLYQDIQQTYYPMETLDKPLKPLSYYKVNELQLIGSKLGINSIGKTKSELYESIMHYFV